MEKVETAWLFNADFEKKLFQDKLDSFESSKLNQEFEFFIHLIEPQKTLYSSKTYSEDYKRFLEGLTGEKFKQSSKPKVIKNWCQENNDINTLKKLQNKFETARFALKEGLWKHEVKFVTKESELRESYLYKRPDGLSGIGHYHFPLHRKQIQRTLKEFGEILEESIIHRSKDFSTLIAGRKIIEIYENYVDEFYQYKGSYFSSSPVLGKEQENKHRENLVKILDYTKSYDGVMSVDGFCYEGGINSICEINTRKTMGHTSYHLWKKYFSNCSEFKLILIKNKNLKKTHNDINKEFNGNVLLVSPLSNKFLVFIFGAKTLDDLVQVEKALCSTLF